MYKEIFLIITGVISLFEVTAGEVLYKYVDPMIGSEGPGRVFIGPSCPFGMTKPGPDCGSGSNSGYLPLKYAVTGFSQTHVSGTGGGPKYGNIQLMPFTGDLSEKDQLSFREDEQVSLGYYGVLLDKHGIKVEITASERVAFYQFTYDTNDSMALKIDAGFFLGEKEKQNAREAQQFVGSEITVVSDTEVAGYSRIRGGWNNGDAYTVYFYARTSQPISHFSTWKGETLFPGKSEQFDSGEKTGVLLAFGNSETHELQVKVGISFISSLKAKENIFKEIPHWQFKDSLKQIRSRWEQLLSRIEVDSEASEDKKKMFYTALYHTMLMPVDRTGENPRWISDLPYYDDFYAIWDTFRTSNPLITLIAPSREVAIVNALLNIYTHDGFMPDARSGNSNGRTQGGSNAEVLICDAYVKGLKGIDYKLALEAMLVDATVPPGGKEEKEGRGGLTDYNRIGYVSSDFVRAGNRTLDYAYDDFCIAMVAKGMGQEELYQTFLQKSDNWKNLWRDDYEHLGAKGFILPRDSQGNWLDEIDYGSSKKHKYHFTYTPLTREYPWYVCHWCGFFYEATSWEYSFSVPHQVPALIEKCGGPEAFRARLDTFFEKGIYNVTNEPSFLTPCLYHWIGRPDLSSQRICQIVGDNYNTSRSGLPGNDDSGAMSSWLAFHMMGLYPNAGQPYYLLNVPMFCKTILHHENGTTFSIVAENLSSENCYIQSATLNGEAFNQAWISHALILAGGELRFQMGPESSNWGASLFPPTTR